MKILHVVCNPSTGVLSLISSLVTAQKKSGLSTSILVIYDKNINISEVKTTFHNINVKYYYSPLKINSIFYFLIHLISGLFKFFNSENTVYHFHNAQLSAAFINKSNSKNSVITIHGFPAYEDFINNRKPLIRKIHYIFFKKILKNKIVTTSVDQSTLNKIKTCFNLNYDAAYVVPNCCEAITDSLSNVKNENVVKFIFIGAMDDNKGISKIINVFNKIQDEYELHIFGSGGLFYPLVQSCRSNKKIIFYGNVQRSEILKILPNYSFYISFSQTEGFSMSLIESLAAGLAVITTQWGDIDQYISNNGFIIDRTEKDLEVIVRRCIDMSFESIKAMRQSSLEIYNGKLTPIVVSENYKHIYESL